VPIPTPPTIPSFPLRPDFGTGIDYNPAVVVHTFDQPGLKTEQRFLLTPLGARRFKFAKHHLSCREYDDLKAHFEQAQGGYAQFPYTVYEPGPGHGVPRPAQPSYTTETVLARYENPNISFDYMVALLMNGPGLSFLEVPQSTPNYTSVKRLVRFPDATLTSALQDQFQQIIPLISVVPRDNPGATFYVSNQGFKLDSQTYLPRLMDWSGISQSIGENSDSASFTVGNADGIWQTYVNQVNLYAASIQVSLYHVGSQYIVDVWKGSVLNWGFDTGGKFQINAADGVFNLSLAYPSRKILRTCWKVYKGRWCPSTSSFPDCPKDYDSCVARGVPHSFGGLVVPPQAVHIKDNSTGVFGFGRSSMTSVTVTQDTVYQRPLQEIFTDEAMMVTVDVAAGRDEDTFYSALGIVGEGPISAYNNDLILQTLDGQPPHDPLHYGGWRAFTGTEPSGQYDFVGISQAGPDGKWSLPDGSPYIPPASTYCGGLAMAEIRRTDQKGLQLSPVSDRAMQVNVTGGIGGWVWNGVGNRTWLPSLHNAVWVAVNVYLRGIGLRVDPSNASLVPPSVMEQYVDVDQAGQAAAICDTVVPKIIGAGTELQFPFRGVLKEQKPLRDWLREILNCCLGYFTFVDGKLWIGIRSNSSVLVGNAFTRATVLFKSLVASPLQPQFNWLVGNFGDEEFGWQLNNVTIYDIDHASFLGTADSPQYLTNTMSFAGVSNKSQCARVIITRLREEIGGLKDGKGPHGTGSGIDEQMNARNFQFRTTVLALNTMVGDIVSITHDTMPNAGYAEGRVVKWTLNPDFSIDMQCTSTVDDMYDEVYGPKPVDVSAPPVPPETLQSATGLAWMPNEVGPAAGDPVYHEWERSFDLWQEYEITRDGVWQPTIWVKGQMAVNRFITLVQPRIVEIAFGPGGNLTGPMVVYAAVTQGDADGEPAVPSNLTAIYIPTGVSNQKVTLTVIGATDAMLTRYDVWAGVDRRRMAFQFGNTGQPPGTIDIAGPIVDNTQGLPEGAAVGLRIAAKHVWHAGVAGLLVNQVIGANQIVCNDFLNSTDTWVGQIAFVCSNGNGDVPLWNFRITAFDPATGTLTVTPDCTGVVQGDVLIVYSAPTALESGLPAGWTAQNSITNSLWNNSVNRQQFPGSAGMTPGEEKGRIVRILRGLGAGQWRFVTDNTALTHQISPPWDVVPDNTSLYIVEAPDWPSISPTNQLIVPHFGMTTSLHLQVPNLTEEVALVGGFLVDVDGHQTDDDVATYRMIYVFGQPPTVRVVADPGPSDVAVTDQTIRCDTSATDVILTLPPLAVYQGRSLLVANDGANNAILNTTPPDTFPDGSTSLSVPAGGTVRSTAGGIYTT
jgi:hypothetical protein